MGEAGYVYILHNCGHVQPSVKIGMTTTSVNKRARELHTTGSPREFVPLFSLHVSNCREVERLIHKHFDEFRTSQNREFFAIAPETAIRALLSFGMEYSVDELMATSAPTSVDLLVELSNRYDGLLDKSIIEVQIESFEDTVALSCAYKGRTTVKRVDLNIIAGDDYDTPLFSSDRLDDAISTFLLLDPYTYIMTTPLFAEPEGQLIADVIEKRRDKLGRFDDHDVMSEVIQLLARDVKANETSREELVARYVELDTESSEFLDQSLMRALYSEVHVKRQQ